MLHELKADVVFYRLGVCLDPRAQETHLSAIVEFHNTLSSMSISSFSSLKSCHFGDVRFLDDGNKILLWFYFSLVRCPIGGVCPIEQ